MCIKRVKVVCKDGCPTLPSCPVICCRFEGKMVNIMEHFHTIFQSISSRMRAEQFKVSENVYVYMHILTCTLYIHCIIIHVHAMNVIYPSLLSPFAPSLPPSLLSPSLASGALMFASLGHHVSLSLQFCGQVERTIYWQDSRRA